MAHCRVLLLATFGVLTVNPSSAVQCLRCFDVAHPADCRETAMCGQGEVCYTREFTDNNGFQGFHLGCEDRQLCSSVIDTNALIGRSVDTDPAPLNRCFKCCTEDVCNSKLCSGETTHSQTGTTAQPVHHVTTARLTPIHCDDPFIKFGNKCFLISTTPLNWASARLECQKDGGDLASVETQQEQDFLKGQLISLDASTLESFWLGGSYSPTSGAWQWRDGSTFTFTAWYPGEPTIVSFDSQYFVYMLNPAYSFMYSNATWSAWQTTNFGYICEKK